MPTKPNAQVAGGFRVVPRQHAQAAGGDGQRLVKAEFGGEIGDRVRAQVPARARAPRSACRSCRPRKPAAPSRTRSAKSGSCSARAVRTRKPRAGWPPRCGRDSASRAGRVPGRFPAPPGSRSTRDSGPACSARPSVPSVLRLISGFLRHKLAIGSLKTAILRVLCRQTVPRLAKPGK